MQLAKSIVIHAPADKVWTILGDNFASISEWASDVQRSAPNADLIAPTGAPVGGRVCHVPGFGDIYETFTDYDAVGKRYTYEATGMPFFVKAAHNSWQIEALDAHSCRVGFKAEMRLLPVIGTLMGVPMRIQLSKVLQNAVEELKYYVETGNLHPRKLKKLGKAAPQHATN